MITLINKLKRIVFRIKYKLGIAREGIDFIVLGQEEDRERV